MIRRRDVVAASLLAPGLSALPARASVPAAARVLRYAFPVAETTFDPVAVSDIYSRTVIGHLFESPYRFDYLARPSKVVPHTAEGMPETADDYRTWTVRIQPGIHFIDDPVFAGKPREVTAADYVYALKRFFDPANKTPNSDLEEANLIGMNAMHADAAKSRRPFDYDREVEGLRVLDRYTFQVRLVDPRPRFIYNLCDSSLYGAVAREVIEHYGDRAGEHPVGSGPYRLGDWRRSSHIVLERNPAYRDVRYDGEPTADDREGQELLRTYKGRKLPMVDRVEVSIIEEAQPRWLSFLQADLDLIVVPVEFSDQAVPGGRIAPYLAKRGIALHREVEPDRTLFFFNMDDPVVGGMSPARVALRRAINLATDVQAEIDHVRRGQAVRAQSIVAPGTWGYDAAYKSENGIFDLARAKALLDVYGYVDRDGDGWREDPDGKTLVVEYATSPDSLSRQLDELWKHNMDALGIRLNIKAAKWPEQLKSARAGQLMIWQLGYAASNPDVQDGLQLLYGPAAGGANLGRFKDARFDRLYDRMQSLPDGPQRLAALRESLAIVTAYAPMRFNTHTIVNVLTQPRLRGFRRPVFGNMFWQYVDIDDSKRLARA